jgi:hypothetical protein
MSLSFLKDIPTVAIVGTAGRGSDEAKLTASIYDEMYDIVRQMLPTQCDIVSGGAAWADHLAVTLVLDKNEANRIMSARFELPCKFENGAFEDNETGRVANYYHKKFSKVLGFDSFKQLEHAFKDPRTTINIGKGFKDRNTEIAKADMAIAFTFGKDDTPKDGGTKDTIEKYFKLGGDFGRKFINVNLHTCSIMIWTMNPFLRLLNK